MRRHIRPAVLLILLFFTLTPFLTAVEPAARPSGISLASVSVVSLSVPPKAWKHFEKARTLALGGNSVESRREIERALEIAPHFPGAYLLRAQDEIAVADYSSALDDLARAQAIEPGVTWSKVLIACAFNGLRRYDDAFAILNTLQGPEAESWQAKYESARAAVGRGDVDGALHWSEQALAAAPSSCIDAHLLRANALELAQRWKEATRELELYLASPGPQMHRAAVLTALDHTRVLAQEQLARSEPVRSH